MRHVWPGTFVAKCDLKHYSQFHERIQHVSKAVKTGGINGMIEHETATPQKLIPPQFNFFIVERGPNGSEQNFLDSIFALRYEVYCKERCFLASEDYPEQQEEDIYDPYSIHMGGMHNSGQMVVTARLILPSEKGFPLMEHCQLFPEYQHVIDPDHLAKHPAAEISRLAMSKSFRRRKGDGDYGASTDPDPPTGPAGALLRRQQPAVVIGIFKVIYHTSKRRGITHWFAAMEKSLLRLLHRFSIDFVPIGPELDYYGPVTPYVADIAEMEKAVFTNFPALYDEMMEGLEPELIPNLKR
jgi:N-acyl amino acid synthase of PEP-CTERM/exosortase system